VSKKDEDEIESKNVYWDIRTKDLDLDTKALRLDLSSITKAREGGKSKPLKNSPKHSPQTELNKELEHNPKGTTQDSWNFNTRDLDIDSDRVGVDSKYGTIQPNFSARPNVAKNRHHNRSRSDTQDIWSNNISDSDTWEIQMTTNDFTVRENPKNKPKKKRIATVLILVIQMKQNYLQCPKID